MGANPDKSKPMIDASENPLPGFVGMIVVIPDVLNNIVPFTERLKRSRSYAPPSCPRAWFRSTPTENVSPPTRSRICWTVYVGELSVPELMCGPINVYASASLHDGSPMTHGRFMVCCRLVSTFTDRSIGSAEAVSGTSPAATRRPAVASCHLCPQEHSTSPCSSLQISVPSSNRAVCGSRTPRRAESLDKWLI